MSAASRNMGAAAGLLAATVAALAGEDIWARS